MGRNPPKVMVRDFADVQSESDCPLPSIDGLIEAAKASGKSECSMKELLSQAPKTPVVARTIAPIAEPEPKPAPRIHDLAHYNLADFPMQAKDVDAEITVHFDITGKSVTEGKKEDIQSFFNDRLKQVKRLILDRNLPNRPIAVNEALRRKRQLVDQDNELQSLDWSTNPRPPKMGI